jgi:hypothetical protein
LERLLVRGEADMGVLDLTRGVAGIMRKSEDE